MALLLERMAEVSRLVDFLLVASLVEHSEEYLEELHLALRQVDLGVEAAFHLQIQIEYLSKFK